MRTPFFNWLIDDVGIWQHTDGTTKIEPNEAYALDDAARGLLVTLLLWQQAPRWQRIARLRQSNVLFNYIHSHSWIGGLAFRGFLAAGLRPAPEKPPQASEDAIGQVVWAIGLARNLGFRPAEAQTLWQNMAPHFQSLKTIRGQAYALLGAVQAGDDTISHQLAQRLVDAFAGCPTDWLWPESPITYAAGIVPYSLLRYSLKGDQQYAGRAKSILAFVEGHCQHRGRPSPIGNNGWFDRDMAQPARYGQQPVEAGYLALAHTAAYELTGHRQYLRGARNWRRWFTGYNIAGRSLVGPGGRCYDGIDPSGISCHSGAESNICWLLAQLSKHHTI